jgi:hypothetical protein
MDRQFVERLIAKHLRQWKDKFEALSWLKSGADPSHRNLAEWSNDESIRVVQQVYDAGAKEVWAVAFDRNPLYESINTLIVSLPEDPMARHGVFRWAGAQAQRDGFTADEDYGQSHLYVWFD